MKFRQEVQELFEKAGWHEDRNVKSVFDSIPRFNEFPEFLKEFLYEYGNLEVETYKYSEEDVTAHLNLKAINTGIYKINNYLDNPRYYGNMITFPIADYHLDVTTLECDLEGNIYMSGDYPCLVSNDFKEGIEKVIMEDYSNTFEWHPEKKIWVQEY
ncbi:SUKH-3 domain-containing protein [Dokdonia sp.]|uniref:SUKH-3 domain-containing protein n=1 Tax=Dokdonia sp. TaxID=2024995 RepID=UPI003265B2F9